jgi:hypothetical protein
MGSRWCSRCACYFACYIDLKCVTRARAASPLCGSAETGRWAVSGAQGVLVTLHVTLFRMVVAWVGQQGPGQWVVSGAQRGFYFMGYITLNMCYIGEPARTRLMGSRWNTKVRFLRCLLAFGLVYLRPQYSGWCGKGTGSVAQGTSLVLPVLILNCVTLVRT